MPLNLSKLSEASLLDKEVDPRELFSLLPEKDLRYKYPRDVQTQVWDRWLERRNERDLVIKMNTGGGKTVVGLLVLKSCLNEQVGPAVYIAPDNYLVSQVLREATDLGIPVTTDHASAAFLQGRAILVVNVYRLVNGKSVFGTADTGIKIPIGAILVDDAHACLATTEAQFTLSVNASEKLFEELLSLFRDDLREQSDTKLLELEAGAPEQEMLVPFWAWHARIESVGKCLTQHRDDEAVMFNWPLVKHHLELCRCVFSGRKVEITPRCLPIEAIPSFVEAKRRIFMTATLADDSILVSDFNAKPEFVVKHITPKVANDIGDRMILVPQEIDPDLSENNLKAFLKEKSLQHNTVVIVPSAYRADFWNDVADQVATATNLEDVVEQLKTTHVGLVVMINKYDGIDLPGEACRILVLDGLPQARRLVERIETNILAGSEHVISRQIQRIEQGMGRGIRGNDDYCVVFLMGASLTKTMFLMGASRMFSPATRAQLEKSSEMASQLSSGLQELDGAIQYCLKQDKDWRRVAREAVANIVYPEEGRVRRIAIAQRAAFDSAAIRGYADAEAALQGVVNESIGTESDTTIGWLKWQLAEYTQFRDAVQAQTILKSALALNRRLTRPIDGIDYERLDAANLQQAQNAAWKFRSYAGQPNSLLIQVNGILDDLVFAPDNANEFEAAMQQVAEFIGFKAQRPELEFKRGPDILWAVGNLRYFVIECKSSATVPTVSKHYANQLSGSANWFDQRYDQTCTSTPILVHPSHIFEAAGTPHPATRVVTTDLLQRFREEVRAFIKAVAVSVDTIDATHAQKLLEHHRLTPDRLIETFTRAPKTG